MTLTTNVHIRLMDAERNLLGWCPVDAAAPGNGTLMLPAGTAAIRGVGERTGMVALVSVHWPDLHAQAETGVPPGILITEGALWVFPWEWPLMVFDTPSDHPPLPAVTVRNSVGVAPPTGALGARSA